MPILPINQAVDVRSYPPRVEQQPDQTENDEHVHAFDNLIPACEFAASLAKEGHLNISLDTDSGSTLDIAEAQRIVAVWESGKVPLSAEEIEY
jgi:hypothetical protein